MADTPGWIIAEAGQPDDQTAIRLGNQFLTGNGYLGYRGTLEEYTKAQQTAVIVAGLYDQVEKKWREPVNLPNGCFVQVYYQDEPLHALYSKVLEHTQTLHLREAVHERRTRFKTKDGVHILVQARRFVSLARLPLICLEYTVVADRDCLLTLCSGIDGDVWDLNGPHLRQITTSEDKGVLSLISYTQEKNIPIVVSEWLGINTEQSTIQHCEKAIYRKVEIAIHAHKPLTLYKFVSCCTGQDDDDPLTRSRQICSQAAKTGFDGLLQEHCDRWAERWAKCDIKIEGDAQAQLALRFSLYHLLSIAPAHTNRISIPARGLSGQMYKGAIFWDTEIFMLPFFTYNFPAIARNLLQYRYYTLDGARRKARQYGYRGAFYAWESQESGDDACTLFNVSDVLTNRPIRTYFRDKQIHISADIVYALWQYWMITGDDSILLDGGAEIVFECARFYLSALYYHPERNRYELLDVTGPDEYHERVHNNVYTNRMVAHTFAVCQHVADYLKACYPERFRALIRTLDFESDLSCLRRCAPSIYVASPDPQTRLIQQFDGYFALEDAPLTEVLARKLHPNEYLGGGNGIATTTQIIKQADVVLMLCLFPNDCAIETKAANWEYYEPRTEHGSSLSACAYALIAAQIGRTEQAYHYFLQTATVDLKSEGKQFVGNLYIGGTHPAANGGTWWALVAGFCGISCINETITIAPHLPAHWETVRLPLAAHGWRLQLTITRQDISIEIREASSQTLRVCIAGAAYSLPPQGQLTIPLPQECLR